MTGSYVDLLLEDPDAGHGEPVGQGDWRLAVEVAIPNQALWRWDVSEWDVDDWSDGYEWHDLSDRYRGAEWTRGRDGLEGRPETGDASIDLVNHDGYLTAWNPSTTFPAPTYLYPGSLVRLGWWDPVAEVYEPAFAGLLQRAVDQSSDTTDADLWITWELVETTAFLSAIDRLAQGEQGGGELGDYRFGRLLDEAGWPFGTDLGGYYSPFDASTLQATTLAGNRLGEVYLTADSVFLDAFSDRRGRLATWAKGYSEPWFYADGTTVVGLRETAGTVSIVRFLPWAAPPEVAVDTEAIINDIGVSRVGGGTASGVAGASVALYGRSPYKRTDLILESDDDLQDWVGYALLINAHNVIKPGAVELDAFMDTACFEALTRLDIGRSLYVQRAHPRQTSGWASVLFTCHVYGYTVRAVPIAPGVLHVGASLNLVVKETAT